MTRCNRVQPDMTLAALPLRGQFMGNRGRLHGHAGIRRFAGKLWITCTLRAKPTRGKVAMNAPGHYTPLFFLDEAVACAAGHRPCAECRRAVYDDFRSAWLQAFGIRARAVEMDAVLHDARLTDDRKAQRRYLCDAANLPAGVFVASRGQPHLIRQTDALPYAPQGYAAAVERPEGVVEVMTPAPLVAVMRAGWQPVMHASADGPNW